MLLNNRTPLATEKTMSKISLSMRPEVAPLGWEEFCATHGPYTIGLDGYVAAGSRFDAAGPRLNLDHHDEVDRLATRATCAQALLAIRQGLFECFRDGDDPRAEVCVNDCDEDVCTSWFLLRHADLAAPGCRVVGTAEMGAVVRSHLVRLFAEQDRHGSIAAAG